MKLINIHVQCLLGIISAIIVCGVLQMAIAHNDELEGAGLSRQTGSVDIEAAGSDETFCNLVPDNVVLTRSSQNEGFHRNLVTDVNLTFEQNVVCGLCWVLLVEVIPSGMYMDLYQVKSAEPFGGVKVLAFEDIDVEKPAYLSPEHTILVYVPHPLTVTESRHHTVQVELPIHLRYHRPSEDPDVTSALVKLDHPYVMIRCQGSSSGPDLETFDLYQAPCDSSNTTMCAWQDLKYHSVHDKPLHFLVPIGQESHTTFVCVGTITGTIAGMVVILWVVFTPQKNKIT